MKPLTFVTGNPRKAELVATWLGHEIAHKELELEEIQTLNLHAVSEHKARQAYAQLNAPVLVEDCSLEFHALGGLPGSFVKWFEEPGYAAMCYMLDGFEDRSATARLVYCLFDGTEPLFFEATMGGTISHEPHGEGFGWDCIFVNDGYKVTRALMKGGDYEATSYRKLALIKLSSYLKEHNYA